MAWYVKTDILKEMRSGTHSQWRLMNCGSQLLTTQLEFHKRSDAVSHIDYFAFFSFSENFSWQVLYHTLSSYSTIWFHSQLSNLSAHVACLPEVSFWMHIADHVRSSYYSNVKANDCSLWFSFQSTEPYLGKLCLMGEHIWTLEWRNTVCCCVQASEAQFVYVI